MIYFFKPYNFDSDNLGAAYNKYLELLQPDDWAVLMDCDTMFLHNYQPKLIYEAIELEPDVGLFTCFCNRVGYLHQVHGGQRSEDTDILHHKDIAVSLMKKAYSSTKLTGYISGFLMAVKARTWAEAGGFNDGFLGVDDSFGEKIQRSGKIIKRIDNLYLFHLYRL